MKLNWGNQNQLIFDSEEEYYMALGIFSNPKLARIYIEDNAKRGSFTDASRLHLYAETQRANLPQALRDAMKDGGRINCNPYVDNLIENHGFLLSGNVVVATLENVLKTIPNNEVENIAAFMKGYYLIQENKVIPEQNITYTTESIDVSKAKLKFHDIPRENASKEMVRRKQGKRDYIKEALNDFEIGEAGEKIVYNHEKQKLLDAYKAGKIENLNDKLEWVSRTDDSLGYDIRSYNVDEKREMYIEVKTTTGSSTTPFYMSENEIDKSRELKDKYYIYRLYKMDRHNPKNVDYFILQGDISTNQHVTIEKRNCRVIINNSTEKL